jgi:hypothetical protein
MAGRDAGHSCVQGQKKRSNRVDRGSPVLLYLFFVSPYPGLGTRSTMWVAGLSRALSTGVNRPVPALRPIVIVLEPPPDFAISHLGFRFARSELLLFQHRFAGLEYRNIMSHYCHVVHGA